MRRRWMALGFLLAGTTLLGEISLAQEARRSQALREKVYDKLSRSQQAAERERWDDALKLLDDVRKMKDLDANETAQLYNAYGYTYFAQERYRESADAYQKVLEQPDLPEALETSTRFTLAQLWFHLEDYAKAVEQLERWLEVASNPGPEPFVLLGQAYYQLDRPRESVEPIERAIAIARQRELPVDENWYALLRAAHHDLGNQRALVDVLRVLVAEYPRREYWLHLAATLGELGETRRQVAAYLLAYEQGFLDTAEQQLLLAQLLLQAQIPYRAGEVLATGIEAGTIPGTIQNWRLLSQAWALAQEDGRAIEALTQAAAQSADGELDARLAQSYASLHQWEKAGEAARVALQRGISGAHEVQLLLGMAMFELERFDEAKAAFREARKTPGGREPAGRWLSYVEREEERLRELRQSLQ